MPRDKFESYRKEIIRTYVKKNDNCTKTDVIKYMSGEQSEKPKVHGSLVTSHKILTQMINNDKTLICIPDKNNSQIHHLTINNENDYNKLFDRIETLSKLSKDIANSVNNNQLSDSSNGHAYLKLAQLMQIGLYVGITAISTEINSKIKSRDDRDNLYSLLGDSLRNSDRLNKIIGPRVLTDLHNTITTKDIQVKDPSESVILGKWTGFISKLLAQKATIS